MTETQAPAKRRLDAAEFEAERAEIVKGWRTGQEVTFQAGLAQQRTIPEGKRFSEVLSSAMAEKRTLLQPRAGVALIREQTQLLQDLTPYCDLLPCTIDAYTRHNRYEDAQVGIERSRAAKTSLLNGFPAVNHGVDGCRRLVDALDKPVQVRHGTPDARLLAEITLASGFTSFEGGGISYNIPYTKGVPLERSIRHWQYCDRLVGRYEEEGIRINREPFGPLTGTLVPPFVSHVVAIVEGLLALEQGAKCITLGYGQAGSITQDIAALRSLRKLGRHYFLAAGFDDFQLSTVFHQWMGGFPKDEAKATALISYGALTARHAGATKIIVKTPHEASGIPSMEANRAGLQASRQICSMASDQHTMDSPGIRAEIEVIEAEVHAVMRRIQKLGNGDVSTGIVKAFETGAIDIPFAPGSQNAGQLTPVRDNCGAIRVFDIGNVPLPDDVVAYHQEKISERSTAEGRPATFQMVVDDVNAISDGKLIGRPS